MAACHAGNGNIKWGTRDSKAKRAQWTLVVRAKGPICARDGQERARDGHCRARRVLVVRAFLRTSCARQCYKLCKCVFVSFFADLLCCMMSLQILSSHQCAILLNLLKMRQTNRNRHFVEHLMCHFLPTNLIKPFFIFTQQSILILIYSQSYTHLAINIISFISI